jgi:hypothetical protein
MLQVVAQKCEHCGGNMAVREYPENGAWREELICLMCGRPS